MSIVYQPLSWGTGVCAGSLLRSGVAGLTWCTQWRLLDRPCWTASSVWRARGIIPVTIAQINALHNAQNSGFCHCFIGIASPSIPRNTLLHPVAEARSLHARQYPRLQAVSSSGRPPATWTLSVYGSHLWGIYRAIQCTS